MREWSSDVCWSDVSVLCGIAEDGDVWNSRESSPRVATKRCLVGSDSRTPHALDIVEGGDKSDRFQNWRRPGLELVRRGSIFDVIAAEGCDHLAAAEHKSDEHTSELQSLMRKSYAVFCFKKKSYYPTIQA